MIPRNPKLFEQNDLPDPAHTARPEANEIHAARRVRRPPRARVRPGVEHFIQKALNVAAAHVEDIDLAPTPP